MFKNLLTLWRLLTLNRSKVYILGIAAVIGVFGFRGVTAPATVSVIRLKEKKVMQLLAVVGTVKAEQEFTIKAEAAGPLKSLLVKEGDFVKAGDLIGSVGSDEAEAEVNRYQAEVTEKKANQEMLEANRSVRFLDEADAVREFNRVARLAQQSASTQADLDRAESNLARAKENVRAAQAEAKLAMASVTVAEALLRVAQARLARYSVVSPRDGQVLTVSVDIGQTLESDQIILQIGNVGSLEIEAEADEAYASELSRGMQVSIRPVGSARIVQGVVKELLPSVNASTGVRQFKVTAPSGDPDIVPGRTVDLNVLVGEYENALSLPRTALMDAMKSPSVLLVDEAGNIARQEVTFRDWPAGEVLITTGLKPGQWVVRKPSESGDVSRRISPTEAYEPDDETEDES